MTQKKQTQFTIPEEFKSKVDGWKANYGKIKYLDIDSLLQIKKEKKKEGNKEVDIEVPEYKQGRSVFFRMPSRQEMSAAENLSVNESGQMDSYKKAEKLMVDCYLGGQATLDEILADIELYMAVAEFCLYNLVERKNVNWGSC